MSLRARLIGLMVLLNLLVLGVIQVTMVGVQRRFLDGVAQNQTKILTRDYDFILAGLPIDSPAIENTKIVQRVFQRGGFKERFRDVLITAGPVEAKRVHLNPLGCAHRDHRTFPIAEVLSGIQRAIDEQRMVPAAGGRCVPIKSDTSTVDGGAWFVPLLPPPPRLSFADYAVPAVLSMLLFGLLAGWVVRRTLGPPLDQLGGAARRVEEGDYSARVSPLLASELRPVAAAFNAMAIKVEGHTGELKREVRRATEEAAAKERAMVVSARLASMGTLAAGVAHEINNPIGGMLNAVHRLSRDPDRDAKDQQYLGLIQSGLERVAKTARRLLDFAPRVLEPVACSIPRCVEAAQALVEHRLEAQGVTFRAEFPADFPPVMGEPNEIQQVLLNLFLNSLNAIGDRRGCSLTVRGRQVEPGIEIRITDDGPGVDAEVLPRVLDPFFSSSNAPDSTGLGLFIAFTIIENHGGSLTVDSTPGAGFEVRIVLPADPEAGEKAPPTPGKPAHDDPSAV